MSSENGETKEVEGSELKELAQTEHDIFMNASGQNLDASQRKMSWMNGCASIPKATEKSYE